MSTTLLWRDGDLYLDQAGRPVEIADQDKAAQDMAEALTVEYDPRRGFGSELHSLGVPEYAGAVVGKALIASRVSEAVDRLKTLQHRNPASTATERITGLTQLQVLDIGSGDYAFYAAAETEDRQPVTLNPVLVTMKHTLDKNAATALNELGKRFGGTLAG